MGAGKLPEQIVQRAEEGLRALEDDRRPDPDIERLRAQPVKRVIKPEEVNRRRKLSSESKKREPTLIEKRLTSVMTMLNKLISRPKNKRSEIDKKHIVTLKGQIKILKQKIIKNRKKNRKKNNYRKIR